MAQRLKKKFIILEIIASSLIVVILFLLINKYLLHSHTKSNIVNNIEQSISVYVYNKDRQAAVVDNIAYTTARMNKNEVVNTYALKLSNKNDKWTVRSDGISKYFLDIVGNQLSIDNVDKHKRFKVLVEGIGESTSFQGKAILDLPIEVSKSFRIYEQEDYVPIFGYHYVSPDSSTIEERRHFLEMHISDFRKQIDYLTNKLNCRWITFGEVMETYVLQDKKIPRRTCVMTFDDGHKDSYKYIFPVLQEFDIPATFYIITDLVGTPGYVRWEQLDEMYRAGNEMGAHTASAEGLIKTDWFERKYHKQFTHDDLVWQITESKRRLEAEGYNPKTFAYPLGEWNNAVVQVIKNNGFIAARDTSRDYTTLDPRAPTVPRDSNIIWHMNYYKPEVDDVKTLQRKMGYNNWWQFEDGYWVDNYSNQNVQRLSSLGDLTKHTYEVVSLPDKLDQISKEFLLANSGEYTMEIFASTGEEKHGAYSYLSEIEVVIDGKVFELQEGNSEKCQLKSGRYYCSFFLQAPLDEGKHTLSVINNHSRFVRFDKFRLSREFTLKENYKLTILEYRE
jgi:peptidoglycan/xylan/chitin deacetylase (PgdA/CDA1 family)